MEHKKPGSVFQLITSNFNLEYAVVLISHPDDPKLLLMCPITDLKITGLTDVRLRDSIWGQTDEHLWACNEIAGRLTPSDRKRRHQEKILQQLVCPEDHWVVAHCGHTFWMEADKLTTQQENMAKYKLKMESVYRGDLIEGNLKWLKTIVHKLAIGKCIEDEQDWDDCSETWGMNYCLNEDVIRDHDKRMLGLERAIHYIQAN